MRSRTLRHDRARRGLPLSVERLEGRALLSTFTVTHANDDTASGSLRWAIGQSNGTPGANTINFNIASSGVQTIAITSALPAITVPVTIDGTTEPGYGSTPVIELNGSGAGNAGGKGVDGLDISSGSATVRGLAIDRFTGEGISLSVAGGDTIEGDFIGTNPAGTVAEGNKLDGVLVQVNSNGNQILGNLISGNTVNGIYLDGQLFGATNPATSGNLVAGNLIGTDVTGKATLGNAGDGLYVQDAPSTTIGGTTAAARNIISGNGNGMELYNYSDNSAIEGNYIGTDITGSVALGNGFTSSFFKDGIVLRGISNSTIGGTAAGAGNVISGSQNHGIDSFVIGSGNIAIQGNLIGTDATGTVALANKNDGIVIWSESDVTIGGTIAGARNVISGNDNYGISTFANGPRLIIQGNLIGTDITGTKPLGNGSEGINATYPGITIGGTLAGAGNIVANNSQSGVRVTAADTPVLSNSIYNNHNLGIELAGGGNNAQAAPVLTSAVSMNTTSTVVGTLTAAAGTYTLQFFTTPGLNPSGNAEGETLLGTETVTVLGTSAGFTLALPSGFSPGSLITATATDSAGDTSQFSKAVTGTGTGNGVGLPTIVAKASPSSVLAGQDATDTFTISNTYSVADSGVIFSDGIPAGTTFKSGVTSTGVPVVYSGGAASAAIGTLAPGQSMTVTIVLTTSTAAIPSFTNLGGVAATSPLIPAGADTASVTTTVSTSADLSVSIVDGGSPPAGGPLDYTVSVTNNGPNDDTEVILTDTLPAGVPYAGASSTQGTFNQSNGVFTADLGTLIAGVTAVVTIHLKPIVSGPVVDSATVGGDLPDPNPANNQATSSGNVLPSADLSVSIAEGTPHPLATGSLDYQVTVTNNGPNADTNVILTDTLPAGVPYTGASSTQGTVNRAFGTLTATFGTLASGATATVTIHLKPAAAGSVVDTAKVGGDLADPDLSNNQSTLTDNVQPVANLAVTISTSSPRAVVGNNLLYTVVVTDNGPDAATNVILTDLLPANATLGSFGVSQGKVAQPQATTLVASLGTIASKASATLTIYVRAKGTGTLTDSASALADQPNLVPDGAATAVTSTAINPPIEGDFDGDGTSDPAAYGKDPVTGKYRFRVLTSLNKFDPTKPLVFDNNGYGFGNAKSIPVPAAYFGDGRADFALWTPNNVGGMTFTVISPVNGKSVTVNFGTTTDLPVIADVDGDGKADFGVYGYVKGQGYRFDFLLSSANFDPTKQDFFNNNGYGFGNAKSIPTVGDFDGSGHAGFGLFNPSASGSVFTCISPSGKSFTKSFGAQNDLAMAVDYDGDGRPDLAVYGKDPATGKYRYAVLTSSSGYDPSKAVVFDNYGYGYGNSTSILASSDYEGTGKADFALYTKDFASKNGNEYVYQAAQTGAGVVVDFAALTDIPIEAPAYVRARFVRGLL